MILCFFMAHYDCHGFYLFYVSNWLLVDDILTQNNFGFMVSYMAPLGFWAFMAPIRSDGLFMFTGVFLMQYRIRGYIIQCVAIQIAYVWKLMFKNGNRQLADSVWKSADRFNRWWNPRIHWFYIVSARRFLALVVFLMDSRSWSFLQMAFVIVNWDTIGVSQFAFIIPSVFFLVPLPQYFY